MPHCRGLTVCHSQPSQQHCLCDSGSLIRHNGGGRLTCRLLQPLAGLALSLPSLTANSRREPHKPMPPARTHNRFSLSREGGTPPTPFCRQATLTGLAFRPMPPMQQAQHLAAYKLPPKSLATSSSAPSSLDSAVPGLRYRRPQPWSPLRIPHMWRLRPSRKHHFWFSTRSMREPLLSWSLEGMVFGPLRLPSLLLPG